MRKNLIWAVFARGVFRVLTIAKTFILARILSPSQFGVFGIAFLVLGLLEMLTETGVNVVLIQQDKKIDDYINTGWVVSIIRGILISLLIVILVPVITLFFNSPESKNILYLTAIIPFLRGFINPSVVKYQKDLEFNKEFAFRSAIIFVEVFATIVIASILKSENSLVFGLIISVFLEIVLSFVFLKPRPKFEFDYKKLSNMISKGKWMTGAKIFDYLFTHGDDIVVGKLLGSFSLGIYQQAYKISSLPIYDIAETFQKVTFATYSKLISENKRVISVYFKTLIATSAVIIPFGIIIYIFPNQIVLLLLGEKWLSAVPVLKVLAVFGIIKTLANSVFPILLAYKRQDLLMTLTLIGIIGLGITIYPLTLKYGLVGAGISTIIGSLVMIPPAYYWLKKVTNE